MHPDYTPKQIARFWSHVNVTDDPKQCWEWTAHTIWNGYGRLMIFNGHKLAHRASWEITNGPIPEGLFVCHTCDNRRCVNPAHLFLGTNQDNMSDMVAKGRQVSLRGGSNPSAKLTETDVRDIREACLLGVKRKRIAQQYGISISTISHIMTGRLWAHLT